MSNYFGEVAYRGVDGGMTSFAMVADAEGAGLSSSVVIILGITNLMVATLAYLSGNLFEPWLLS
ncbi:MAG: hypothetical protein R2813_07605 [Flavobacteriales bacterium]